MPDQGDGLLNVVLHGLHGEMALPFPRPTACCISNQHCASHIPTNTIYVPIGESRSIQHFAHLYRELGHYLLLATDDSRLQPAREGLGRASAIVDAHYTDLALDKAKECAPARVTDFIEWARMRWPEWMPGAFCDLFGVFGGGPAGAWAYLHMAARNALPAYRLDAFGTQTHPPGDARMETMCEGLRLMGFSGDADAIWARWRDAADAVGGARGEACRHAAPKRPPRDAARAIYESLGETSVILCDPGSRGREGWRMRTLLNDAWDVFWRSRHGEFQEWEAAEIERLVGQYARAYATPPSADRLAASDKMSRRAACRSSANPRMAESPCTSAAGVASTWTSGAGIPRGRAGGPNRRRGREPKGASTLRQTPALTAGARRDLEPRRVAVDLCRTVAAVASRLAPPMIGTAC